MNRPEYKTWIRTKAVAVFGVLTFICLGLSFLGLVQILFFIWIVPAIIFGYIFVIVGLSAFRFSPKGGDYQNKIHQLIVSRVSGNSVLDIGCGSGHLLSKIAKANPGSKLTGIDFWGKDWEYSKELCIENFKAEAVLNQAEFKKESASKLPADLGVFDCIVSCLTFHEVQDIEDKTVSIQEALRHLRPGGKFVFIDLFRDKKFYPEYNKIEDAIKNSGCKIIEKSELLNLPFPLKHSKVLGFAELIVGMKSV